MLAFVAMPFVSAQETEEGQDFFQGIDGLYKKEHIANKKFIPYKHVREADVLWMKTIWRIIDLREKQNLPLYYPTTPVDSRRSLIRLIYDAAAINDIQLYSTSENDEFAKRMEFEDFAAKIGATAAFDTVMEDINTGEMKTVHMEASEGNLTGVQKYLIKEVWFFDRRYSYMDSRIIGICPILEQQVGEGESARFDQIQLCWIYFPQLRPFLSQQEVYNTRNDAQRESMDDIFHKRHFSSYIFKEANVYDNRSITMYASGRVDTRLESERIKELIFTKEHDMWEY